MGGRIGASGPLRVGLPGVGRPLVTRSGQDRRRIRSVHAAVSPGLGSQGEDGLGLERPVGHALATGIEPFAGDESQFLQLAQGPTDRGGAQMSSFGQEVLFGAQSPVPPVGGLDHGAEKGFLPLTQSAENDSALESCRPLLGTGGRRRRIVRSGTRHGASRAQVEHESGQGLTNLRRDPLIARAGELLMQPGAQKLREGSELLVVAEDQGQLGATRIEK